MKRDPWQPIGNLICAVLIAGVGLVGRIRERRLTRFANVTADDHGSES